MDSAYALDGGIDGGGYSGYFDGPTLNSVPSGIPGTTTTGSTALYHHNGTRYGLGLPVRNGGPAENKLNGLNGSKNKRGDIDRECKSDLEANVYPFSLAIPKSTASLELGLKIFKGKYHPCAGTNTVVDIYKRSWKKVPPTTET